MKSARHTIINKGFTLIELLVVIGILGILATALVATIDPFEQLRKAQDSNVKNAAVEFLNANLRYYTTHNAMPWAAVAEGGYTGCGANAGSIANQRLDQTGGSECMDGLIDDGELKQGFSDAVNITQEIFVTGGDNTVTACYQPQSKSGQNDPNTKYDSSGTEEAAGTCKSQDGAQDCYYCTSL